MGLLAHLKDVVQGKAKLGQRRSPHWPKVRAEHLKKYPRCAVCGGTKGLQAHHIEPFHLNPALELDPQNLVTLCEHGGVNHHLLFGHLASFKSWNSAVAFDARAWAKKLARRP